MKMFFVRVCVDCEMLLFFFMRILLAPSVYIALALGCWGKGKRMAITKAV